MAQKKKKTKKKKSVRARRIQFGLKIFLLVFLLTLLLLGSIFYVKYGNRILKLQQEAKALVSQSDVNTFRQSETSQVFDSQNKLLSVLKGEKDVYYIYYEDIPDYAVDAMIAIEDKKFQKHQGVDIKANIRAVAALIRHKGEITQGASTITQQLARNIFLTQEVSWERKVKEIFLAMQLEKKYEKYQLMEFYLNNIYFANGYYGIQAASKGYFSENVTELSLSQIVFLCAIPNNPTLYDPVDNPDNTLKRRDRILVQMLNDGYIDQGEYNNAVNEVITLKQSSFAKRNYIDTFVNYCATRALMFQQGFEFRTVFTDSADKESYNELYSEFYTRCQQSLFSGGYRIYTSIDVKKQKMLQNSLNEELKNFKEVDDNNIYKLQGAAVCIDNETGRVAAIVGGRSQKTEGYTLNRGYQSFRQPGSAIKPLIVYTPAFERGYTPDSIVTDEKLPDGPKNSDGVFSGKMTVRTAVEKSKNTIAWKLLQEITPAKGLEYLKQMGFVKISNTDNVPAASLGGLTVGTSPLEMTSAFAALENDGKYREPTCIVSIRNSKGEEVVGDMVIEKVVYEVNASRIMTDVLEGVLTRGTGRSVALKDMPCAGKTGTTDDKKDGWFIGYTPYYTTGVWVGYDIPKTLQDLSGSSYPGRIWKSYMDWLDEGLQKKDFPAYEAVPNAKTPEPTATPEIFFGLDPEETPVSEEPAETEIPIETEMPIETDIPIETDVPGDFQPPNGGDMDFEGDVEWDDGTDDGQPEEETESPPASSSPAGTTQ